MAHRPVRGRVAQGASRGPGGGAKLPRRLRAAPERGLHRQHKRGLRRGGALHAARLRRSGLERGGGAPRLGAHGSAAFDAERRVKFERSSGILLHPTSFPGPFGAGDFGEEAHRFIDFLAASGQAFWQIMPLGPTGWGGSPYSSISAFTGNVNLVSPAGLVSAGLLEPSDIEHPPDFEGASGDDSRIVAYRRGLLEKAF